MQARLKELVGGAVLALDGDIGTIHDFYFDDEAWTVRYMVVHTGNWLPGRRVLISLWALLDPDWQQMRVPVRLTRQQVQDSPPTETERPVSREAEAQSLGYYGYPLYWGGPALWGPVAVPAGAIPPPPPFPATPIDDRHAGEHHLRSCREVAGYHLQADDGEIGHVDDFLVDGASWRIEALVVDTSNWPGGRTVAVPRAAVRSVSWAERIVKVALSKDAVASSPEPHHV